MRESLPLRGDLTLFEKYFHPASYAEYKSLFLPSDWYGLSEADFNSWQSYLHAHEMQIESVITYEDGGSTYSCIQYYIMAEGVYDRASFLAKKINNFWYPTSEQEDISHGHELGFFRSVRPQFLEYLIEEKELPAERNSMRASTIRSRAVKNEVLSANTLLMDKQTISSFRSDEFKSLYYNLEERTDPETWFASDRLHDAAFHTYLDSLGIPQVKQQEVMALIENFQYLKAAVRIARHQGSDLNTPLHADAIRRIYGNDRLLEIASKPEHE
jgi:hypothetical protein